MVTHADDGQSLLGGISSQFRINPYTGQHLEVRRASGATIETTDGGRYLDMFMAHGSTVLGHAHPDVVRAIREILEFGVVIGYETGLGEEVAHRTHRDRALRRAGALRRLRERGGLHRHPALPCPYRPRSRPEGRRSLQRWQ